MSIQTKSGLKSVPAGKLDINLANSGDIKKLQKDPRITQEIKDRILSLSEQVSKGGNDKARLGCVFCQWLQFVVLIY